MANEIPQEWVEKAADSMSIPYLRVLLMAAGGDLEANRNITEAIARAALTAVAPLIRADERERCKGALEHIAEADWRWKGGGSDVRLRGQFGAIAAKTLGLPADLPPGWPIRGLHDDK
jgi:hypothetical protein